MYICIYVYMYIPGWWRPTACAPGPSSAPAPATELGESSLGKHTDLLKEGAVPILGLEPLLKEVGGEGEPLLLHLLPPLHHLQQHHRPVEVSSKLEHPDVRVFIILPVLPCLHLFRTTTETDVWVDAASSCSLFRLRFD